MRKKFMKIINYGILFLTLSTLLTGCKKEENTSSSSVQNENISSSQVSSNLSSKNSSSISDVTSSQISNSPSSLNNSSSEQNKVEDENSEKAKYILGNIENNRYTNEFFKFSIVLPENYGRDEVPGNKKISSTVQNVDELSEKFKNNQEYECVLLNFFIGDYGVRVYGINLNNLSEKENINSIYNSLYEKNLLGNIENPSEIMSENIGGKDFYYVQGGIDFKIRSYFVVLDDSIITFVINTRYDNDEGIEKGSNWVKTIEFK